MSKVKAAAEVHYSANAGGYYVLNRRYRTNRACTHLFTSREDALAFARAVAALGARAATASLPASLTPVKGSTRPAAQATASAATDAPRPTHVWVGNPVKRETPPDEDLLDAFGPDAVRRAQIARLNKLLEHEVRPQYLRHYRRQLRALEGEAE